MGVWSGGGYHAREEFDLWWFVGIVFIKLHDEFKGPIFKRCISRSNNNRIPTQKNQSAPIQKQPQCLAELREQSGRRERAARKVEGDRVPSHDIFTYGTCTDSCRWIRLHSLHTHPSASARDGQFSRGGLGRVKSTLKSRIKRRRAEVDMIYALGIKSR